MSHDSLVRERFHRWLRALEHPQSLAEMRTFLEESLSLSTGGEALLDGQTLGATAEHSPAPPMACDARTLAFHAPLGLLEGAWLQCVAQAGNSHRAEVNELFAAYLAILGKDEADAPAAHYRGALARAGVSLAEEVSSWRFAADARLGVPALEFASLQLALGWHAAEFLPEVIGYTLAYARSQAPWRLYALPDTRRNMLLQTLERHAQRALRRLAGEPGDERRRRLRRGVALYVQAEARYRAALAAFWAHPPTLAQQVGELFRRKARYALGYHGKTCLAGRSLDAWFADEPFDALAFLDALARSPWFAARAEESCPFDRLTAFGGPMFGVFSGEELALIDAWRHQSEGAAVCQSVGEPAVCLAEVKVRVDLARPSSRRIAFHKPVTSRELFHRLLGADQPAVCDEAARWVERILRRAGRDSLFAPYSPQALNVWVENQYAQQNASYRPPTEEPLLTREDYIFAIRQFAPAILVDGCWLQYLGEAAWQGDRLHRLLWRIYADELGAGQVERHHGNVYRALLASLGVVLPPCTSEAFSRDESLLDSAFDLPAYLLAISRFPRRYLAEILGLNLAIELSGLGGQYRALAEALRRRGIDPLIVTLHQSIDTLAGGHAALALEAVQLHLDNVAASAGEAALAREWQRVCCGYRSLASATRRFKRALLWAYVRRGVVARWLRRRVGLLKA